MTLPALTSGVSRLRALFPLALLCAGALGGAPCFATIVLGDPLAEDAAPPEVLALRQAAEGGSVEAAVELGKTIAEGRLVPGDPFEGERWLRQAHEAGFEGAGHPLALLLLQTSDGGRLVERAAEALGILRRGAGSDPDCALTLGQLYLGGQFVAADFDQAERCFREAADLGSAEAWHWLGRLFSGDSGFPERADHFAAVQCLETGFAKGSLDAGQLLVDWLRGGEKAARDEARAFELVRTAAEERGSLEALVFLGELYESGSGTAVDPAKAAAAYESAAAMGSAEGMTRLGLLLAAGAGGLAPDAAAARDWFERAAALDHAPARYQLALLIDRETGESGEAPGGKAAAAHLVAAANAGYPEAQDRLGSWYRDGRHVVKDLLAATSWFQAAAAAGHLTAKINLAQILEANRRNAEDLQRALSLYGESAAGGHPAAHFHLARLLRPGSGSASELARAHAHAAKAVEAGFGAASELLMELEGAMNPSQRAESVTLQESLTALPLAP